MKYRFNLIKEIEILKKEIIYKGMRQFTTTNIQKQKKQKELIKKSEQILEK